MVEEGAAEEQVAEQVEEPEEGKGHQAVVEHRAVLRAQLVRGAAVPALLVDGEQQREEPRLGAGMSQEPSARTQEARAGSQEPGARTQPRAKTQEAGANSWQP